MTPAEMLALQRQKAASRKPKLISRSKVPMPYGWPAWIDEVKMVIKSGSYIGLRQELDKLIKQKKLDIPDPASYLDYAICEGIRRERGNNSGFCAMPYPVAPNYSLIQSYHSDPRGPKNLRRGPNGRDAFHWKALHLAALDGKMSQDFLETFTRTIGCGSCKSSWKTIMRNVAPQFSFPTQAFEFSVAAHNAVNKKLSPPKPEISLEDAKRIWST